MVIKEFDVLVIGSGVSGKSIALDCASEGMKVAIADNREFGGTCAIRGCIPKKVLAGVTEVIQSARNLEGKGLESVPKIDWKSLQKFNHSFTNSVPLESEKSLKKAGITLFHQSPQFIDEHTLSVEGKTVKASKIVIATGLIPMELNITGREHLKISDDFLSLEELPEEIVFVGGGYIGMELAHIAARCGAKVTIIEFGDSILEGFDQDLTSDLTEVSKDLGINFILGAEVNKVEKLQKNYRVFYDKGGEIQSIKTEMVFNTAGRIPSLTDLDLSNGNVKTEKRGVMVNEFLQSTSNPNVYACGDAAATSFPPLTPSASLEAKVLSENIRKGNNTKLPQTAIPSVIHCVPQLAMVGLNESDINGQKDQYEINHEKVSNWFNAKHLNEKCYSYKVIIDKNSKIIVGAHILSPTAGEIINLFTMAINQKLTVGEIKNMVFAYPTWASDIKSML